MTAGSLSHSPSPPVNTALATAAAVAYFDCMDKPRRFPSPTVELLMPLLAAVGAHFAVLAGGIVRPESVALLRAAKQSEFDLPLWALYFLSRVADDPGTPFTVTVVWALAGFLLAYLALRLLVDPFVASALMSIVLLCGYPGWTELMPARWIFYLPPAALSAVIVAAIARRRLGPLRDKLAKLSADRYARVVWIVLVVFMFFVVAEHVRVGLRGSGKHGFPYADVGLDRGFDKELDKLRRVHHLSDYVAVLREMKKVGLRVDLPDHCLAAHGAAARYVCRVGAGWGEVTRELDPLFETPTGWMLAYTPRTLSDFDLLFFLPPENLGPTINRGGIRYPRLLGSIEGAESHNWFVTRAAVIRDRPQNVRIHGPLYRRAVGRNLWIEVECDNAAGVKIAATLAGTPLRVIAKTMSAGDRLLVRGTTRLDWPEPRSGLPLEVTVAAPHGILDLDVMISPEDPADKFKDESELGKQGFAHPLM